MIVLSSAGRSGALGNERGARANVGSRREENARFRGLVMKVRCKEYRKPSIIVAGKVSKCHVL
jgi:hypothetical protein